MLTTYLEFLSELKLNNNKAWFDANRDRWKVISKDWQILIQEIIHEIAKFDHTLSLTLPKQCVYRINRDVRFSNNKNPYKDCISAIFSPQGKSDGCIGYYFEITNTGNLRVGGGWYELDPKRLLAVRHHIAENLDDVQELREIIEDKKFLKTFGGLSTFWDLKTHPKGFDKDNVNIDLLKHRNYVSSSNKPLKFKDDADFVALVVSDFKAISPFIKFLRKWENLT